MWKIALLAFLYFTPYFASAGRLPRSNDEDQGCLPGEDCRGNENCSPGEVYIGEMCYKLATESQNECVIQEQCSNINGSVCSTGICVGQTGLGEPCSMTLECDPNKNLTCESGACVCLAGTVEAGEHCVQDENLCANGTCSDNEISLCSLGADGKCECKEGSVLSEDGESCLKLAEELGEECESTKQCEKVNGTCEDGICREGALSPVVVPAMGDLGLIGTECGSDEDCKSVDHSICKESICQCREDFFQSEEQNKCLPFARKVGDPCQMEKQCSKINKSTCMDGKCTVVASAGVHTRKSGSRSSFKSSVAVVAFVVAGSWAVFA